MKIRLLTVGLAVLALGVAPATAAPLRLPVNIEFQSFAPTQLDALPGDTVQWSNTSERAHTVTANDGSFDSGEVPGGGSFARQFDAPGVYAYYCSIHRGMFGEVDVRRVTLDPLASAPVPAGRPVMFTGRSADVSAGVNMQQATSAGYRTVASSTPSADGRWSVTLKAPSTGDYRASSGGDVSETRRLRVVDRKALVRATSRGLRVTVLPLDPGATVLLELFQRERFGWWPVQRTQLDYASRAEFRVRGPALARVVAVDRDGWTPLFTSRVLRLPRSH
jgi:plastocyanin